ncbi:hypothetical protein SpCBS45565_g02695 [Spizellomyces sp. 'palustris']|nr:hypothetical protein SpCBS45565_g02695 [Spizellomyces sp. 'palustris']
MNLAIAAFQNDVDTARACLVAGWMSNGVVRWDALKGTWVPPTDVNDMSPFLARDLPDGKHVYDALPLNLAVIAGNVEIVKILLEAGAQPQGKDGRSRSALACAIYGSIDTLEITAHNFKSVTQCRTEHITIAQLILRHLKSQSNSKEIFDQVVNQPQEGPLLRGITLLCLAAYLGKSEQVRVLLEEGADVNGRDKNGATALMYAARDGHMDVVRHLLAFDANTELEDVNGWTAIRYCRAYPEITSLLEDARSRRIEATSVLPRPLLADLNAKYPNLPSSLSSYLALRKPKDGSTSGSNTPYQMTPGASPQFPPNHYNLIAAIKHQDLHALQLVLQTCSEDQINQVDATTGLTPLQYAVRSRPFKHPESETIVRILVAIGAEVNTANQQSGKTPLHYVVRDPYPAPGPSATHENGAENLQTLVASVRAMVRFLISSGANVDVPDLDGNRPLHFACKTGDEELVKILLQDGHADPNVTNKKGRRPVDLCRRGPMRELLGQASVAQDSHLSSGTNSSTITSSDKSQRPDDLPQKHVHFAVPPTTTTAASVDNEDKITTPMLKSSDSAYSSNEGLNALVDQSLNRDQSGISQSSSMSSLHLNAVEDDRDEKLTIPQLNQLVAPLPDEQAGESRKGEEPASMQSRNTAQQGFCDVLTAYEDRNLQLEGIIRDMQAEQDHKDTVYQEQLVQLEHALNVERKRSEKAVLEMEMWKKQYADAQTNEAEARESQKAMHLAYERAMRMAADLAETVGQQRQRILELENPKIVPSVFETPLVGERLESTGLDAIDRKTTSELDQRPILVRLAEIDLHLDILRANAEAVAADIQEAESSLQQVHHKRDAAILETNATQRTIQTCLGELHKDEQLLVAELCRLRRERTEIEDQLKRTGKDRDLLWENGGKAAAAAAGTSERDLNTLSTTIRPIDVTGNRLPSGPGTGFVTLEALLNQFQLESSAPISSSQKQSRRRSTLRLSTIFDDQEVDVDLDSALLSRLLYAAKKRIHSLKNSLASLQTSYGSLQMRLDEREDDLLAANHRITEAEANVQRVKMERTDMAGELRAVRARERIILSQRMEDVKLIRKLVVILLGKRCVSGERVGLSDIKPDAHETDATLGLLGNMQRLISELDPSITSRLPPYSMDSALSDEALRIQCSPAASESGDFDEATDIQRRAERALTVLTLAIGRFKAYFGLIKDVLTDMKVENQKFVREIVNLKRGGTSRAIDNEENGIPNAVSTTHPAKPNDIKRSPQQPASPPSQHPAPIPDSTRSSSSASTKSSQSTVIGVNAPNPTPLTATPAVEEILQSLQRSKSELAALEKTAASTPAAVDKRVMDGKRKEYMEMVKCLMRAMRDDGDKVVLEPTPSEKSLSPSLASAPPPSRRPTPAPEPSPSDKSPSLVSAPPPSRPSTPTPEPSPTPKNRGTHPRPVRDVRKHPSRRVAMALSRSNGTVLPTLYEEGEEDGQSGGLVKEKSGSLLDRLKKVNYHVLDLKNAMRRDA